MTPGAEPAVKRLRDTHHMVARLFAMGLRPRAVAERTGYSLARISTLRQDPAFEELIACYRQDVDQSWREELDDYFGLATKARNTAVRMICDQLEDAEETGEKIPIRTLVTLNADLADRTGFGKRSTQVNLNVDFAAQLDRAIKRSRGPELSADLRASEERNGVGVSSQPPRQLPPAPRDLRTIDLEPVSFERRD